MALDPLLKELLRCPETKQPVSEAPAELLEKVNLQIREGQCSSKDGSAVSETLQSALIREDGKLLYPIRDDIPVMLIGEAIPLS